MSQPPFQIKTSIKKEIFKHGLKVIGVLILMYFVISSMTAHRSGEAATYNWTQTDWSGGVTANTAVHPTNQTSWNEFSSTTGGINYSIAGVISGYSTTQTTDTDFSGGTFSNTSVSGSGDAAIVRLVDPTVGDIPNNNFSNGSTNWTKSASYALICSSTAWLGILSCGTGCYQGSYGDAWFKSTNFILPENVSQLKAYTSGSQGTTNFAIKRSSDNATLCSASANGAAANRYCTGLSSYAGTEAYVYAAHTASSNCGNYGWVDDFNIQDSSNNNLNVIISGYYTSGTFTSSVIDTGMSSKYLTTDMGFTNYAHTGVSVDMRAGNTATPDGSWTSWQTGISNGGDISIFDGNRYLQYRLNFTRSGGTINSLEWDYTRINRVPYFSELTSSAYNTSDAANVLSDITWSENLPSGTDVGFQVRTAPDNAGSPGAWTQWFGGATTTKTPIWRDTGSTLPVTLAFSQSEIIGSYVYLFGGYNGSAVTNAIYRAPTSDPTSWASTGTTLPGAISYSQSAVVGDYVYLFGGQDGGGYKNIIYRAPTSDPTSWSNTGSTLPGNLSESQAVTIGSYVYLFGGNLNGTVSNIIYKAPTSDPTSWSNTGSTLPGNLSQSQAAVIGSYVYLFGGRSGASYTNVIYRAPTSDPTSWSDTGSILPGNLGWSQLKIIGDYVYLFGGYDGSNYKNVIYRAPVSDPTSWSDTGIVLPTKLGISQSEIIGSYMYLFGGVSSSYEDVIYTSPVEFFTDPAGGESIPSVLSDGINDQWIQYKALLMSNGTNSPTVSDVTITYVVNASPEFDSTFGNNGVSASQISDSADPNWGKVKIEYSIQDPDTTSGSVTPGYITPSIEYNIGSGWVNITSDYLSAGALDNKAVSEASYNTYTAYWDAKSQIPNTYYANMQIRVTVDDNEGANNTAQASSVATTLDTENVAVTTFGFDSTTDSLTLNINDSSNIEYRLSNNIDLSADGQNASSGEWQSVGGSSTSTTISWAPSGAPSFETIYLQTRDLYGNSATSTAIAPPTPINFDIKDVTNIQTEEYRLFIAWQVYTATSSITFQDYKIYRSTDGTNFSLLSTITDSSLNYYRDNNVSSTTRYYYKVKTTSTGGNISNYSDTISDIANGQGGTDATAPTISNVAVAETQASWARITWDTDELSNSTVEFSTLVASDYSSSTESASFVTSHEVYVGGLAPNTSYIFRIKSTDPSDNQGSDNNNGNGYTFNTAEGALISNVSTEAVNDNSATILWNTDTDANSYVVYSTNLINLGSDTNVTTAGSASLVGGSGPLYQHRVILSDLTPRTTYYYYVKSTDALSNVATDKNSGAYYTFTTTYDTEAPVISNIATPIRTTNSIIITWTTNELADSQILYGTASGNYSNSTTLDATRTINHVAVLENLTENTTYYYLVRSKDAASNTTTSSEQSAATTERDVEVVVVGGGGGGGVSAKDTTPPIISDVKISKIGPFDATVTFNTNEDTIGFALYGQDTGYDKVSASKQFKKSHTIRIFGLELGTDYNIKAAARDKAGNLGESKNFTFTTQYAAEALEDIVKIENIGGFQKDLEGLLESITPSLVPPFISNLNIQNITESSADVIWQTNIPAYGLLSYAADNQYDETKSNPYAVEISQTEQKTRDHLVNLSGLSPATLYHIQAKAYILPGAQGRSADTTFYTKASKISPRAVNVGNTSAEIRWSTKSETSSFVEFRNLATGEVGQVGDNERTTNHSVHLKNLKPGITYSIRSFGYNINNNIVEGDPIKITTKRDTTSPVISSIKIDNALLPGVTDRLQTVILWKTDEPANSVVYFQEGIGTEKQLLNKTGQTLEYTLDHAVIITAMKPSTVYRIQIASTDTSGNETQSPIRSILTPRSAESIMDIIFKNLEESFGFLKQLR